MSGPVISTSDDLISVAGDNGFLFESPEGGFAGRGVRAETAVEWADSLVEPLTHVQDFVRDSGEAAVAFVQIPFWQGTIRAVIPEVIVVGQTATDTAPAAQPNINTVDVSSGDWDKSIAVVLEVIEQGEVEKVVLARHLMAETTVAFSQEHTLRALHMRHRSTYRYAFDGFVGASPELLIRLDGKTFSSQPLAGTAPRLGVGADQTVKQRLLASAKDNHEHRVLVEAMRKALTPLASQLSISEMPELMTLADVHHLATKVSGTVANGVDIAQLIAALHPTPAVAGTPRPKALELIAECEGETRGNYAGLIGTIDSYGNGSFAIALRGAQLEGNRAHLWAGAGIVAGSNTDAEFNETEAKSKSILNALR